MEKRGVPEREPEMAEEANLWDIVLGILGIDTEGLEEEIGVIWVPNG